MQYSNIALAVLLPLALAVPSNGHGHGHGYLHRLHQSGHVSGAPAASGTAGAPYGLSNATVAASGTGTGGTISYNYVTTTIKHTVYQTVASNTDAPNESAAVQAKYDNGAGDSCGDTVTITSNPTVTVTVTGNGAPIESAAESFTLPASTPSTSAEASTVVAESSPGSTPSAPAESSTAASATTVTPEGRSPETSEASVPTQAATSASVSSSIASVAGSSTASVIASPSASPSSATASSPVAASVAGPANFCSTQTSAPGSYLYSGANYTGGVKGSKKGMVFVAGIADQTGLVNLANSSPNMKWLGNYFSAPPPNLASSVTFIPQMYGVDSTQYWDQNAVSAQEKDWKNFFSFGEPGTPNAELYQDPTEAAHNFMNWMQPYTLNGTTIGAPGCLQNPQDLEWDAEFLCACEGLGCNIGFLAMHWFSGADPIEAQWTNFTATVEAYINVAQGKPIWIDNIWAPGTNEQQMAFIDRAVPYLEDNAAVIRYGWVPQDSSGGTGFVDTTGAITTLGQHYLNA